MFSMLAIGPTISGFKPGRGDGFLREIKICNTPFFGEEVKSSAPCRKTLRNIKYHLEARTKIL
jgi:hypothetical protein